MANAPTQHNPHSPLIFGMYSGGILAGALYSIPPFYFKRFPIVAAATIAFVRGFSLNFGVYYAVRFWGVGVWWCWGVVGWEGWRANDRTNHHSSHLHPQKTNTPKKVREALGIPFQWNPIVVFITRFMTVFAAVIAVSKDLPDTEGDAKHGVKTFATVCKECVFGCVYVVHYMRSQARPNPSSPTSTQRTQTTQTNSASASRTWPGARPSRCSSTTSPPSPRALLTGAAPSVPP